jgi:hypothetical protein
MAEAAAGSRKGFERLTAGRVLWIGLAALAVLGVLIVRHYGEGVDEWHNVFFGWAFVHAYENYNLLTNPGIDYFNGPFFMMIWVVVSQALHWAIPSWMLVDGRHFTTFITFIVGLWLLYKLCLRFTSPRTALLTTALFASQPVLFGHAFLNQKDTPLMVSFLASVVAGWAAADRLMKKAPVERLPLRMADDWCALNWRARLLISLGVVAGSALLLDLWVFHGLLRLGESVVQSAYQSESWPLVNRLFERVATDAYKTPLSLYIGKFDRAVFWLRLPVSALVFAGARWGALACFPQSAGRRLRSYTRDWGLLALAGLLVGATTSIRIVGPFAAALVVLILLAKLGRRGIIPSLAMGLIAVLTTYLTWPVLWGDPVGQFLAHVGQTTEFTSFSVLYAGSHYESTNLPWHYLPWLLMIQLTLPAVAAVVAGIGYAIWRGLTHRPDRLGLVVIALWAGVPAAAVMLGWVSVYNDFRHELFIMPALFALAGMGLQWAFQIPLQRYLKIALAALLILPGLVGIVRLHPYEYIYYNALVGGTDGAVGRYEMDYWCTSFREAMGYVDDHAPPGAEIGVTGALTNATPFARDDLTLYLDRPGRTTPDLGLTCKQGDVSRLFPGLHDVYVVHRGAAVLAVVKGPGG